MLNNMLLLVLVLDLDKKKAGEGHVKDAPCAQPPLNPLG